jgi:hypothetical protein
LGGEGRRLSHAFQTGLEGYIARPCLKKKKRRKEKEKKERKKTRYHISTLPDLAINNITNSQEVDDDESWKFSAVYLITVEFIYRKDKVKMRLFSHLLIC